MVLGSTQPLIEMSTGEFPGGKDGLYVRLETLASSSAVLMKSGNLYSCNPLSHSKTVTGLLYFYYE